LTRSICFVASTLPASFIKLKAEALGIDKVIVISKPLWHSYMALKDTHPKVMVSLAPKGLFLGNAYLFFTLLLARMMNREVIFFHECCCPIFDLFVKLIRPRGKFFPQVTMTGYEKISYKEFPKGNFKRLFDFLRIDDLFTYYKASAVGSEGCEFVISTNSYPDSISVYDAQFSRDLINTNIKKKSFSREILFLTGKSKVADDRQIELYKEIIRIALSHDFKCYIKDHPNSKYRLNLDTDEVTSFDPLLPVELLDDDFSLVVGTSSTGLLSFGSRAISLIDVIPEITPEDIAYLKSHFHETDSLNLIRYIQDLKDFEDILSGIKV
jgi:hypothetical protein